MKKRLILIIDDDPADAELTRIALLQELGDCSWHRVSDGVEALAYLLSKQNPFPDLIILDLNLPRIDGLEVLNQLKKEWGPALRDLKVVVLSSSYEPKDRNAARELGVRLYLQKPIGSDDTKRVVGEIARFLDGH